METEASFPEQDDPDRVACRHAAQSRVGMLGSIGRALSVRWSRPISTRRCRDVTACHTPLPGRQKRILLVVAIAVGLLLVAYVVARMTRDTNLAAQKRAIPEPRTEARERQRSPAIEPRQAGGAVLDQTKSSGVEQAPVVAAPSPPEHTPRSPASIDDVREEATRVSLRLVEAFPDSPEALAVLALAYNRFGNSSEAEKAWQRCLELDPGFADAYRGLGSIALKRGRHEEAVILLQKGLQTGAKGPEIHHLLAEALMGAGRVGDVVALLEDYLKTAPGTMQTFFWLGQACLGRSEYQKAKQYHQAAIQRDPDCTYSYYGLARACARLGQRDKSREYLEKFNELKAQDRRAERERMNNFDDLASVSKSVAYIYSAVAGVYRRHGELRQAEAHWLRAAALDPENTYCRIELVSLYQRQNKIPQTRRMMAELSRIHPENIAYRLNVGILSAQLEEFDKAEEAFQQLTSVAPENPAGYLALAQLYLDTRQNPSQAAKLARTAVSLQPTAPNYFLLATACARSGDLPGAFAAIKQAVECDPDNPEYRQAYASIQEKMTEEKMSP